MRREGAQRGTYLTPRRLGRSELRRRATAFRPRHDEEVPMKPPPLVLHASAPPKDNEARDVAGADDTQHLRPTPLISLRARRV